MGFMVVAPIQGNHRRPTRPEVSANLHQAADPFRGAGDPGVLCRGNDAFYQEFAGRQRAAFIEAEKTWQVRSAIDFPVILFRASNHDMWGQDLEFAEDYGWGRYVGDRLHIVRVVGGHRSIIERQTLPKSAGWRANSCGSPSRDGNYRAIITGVWAFNVNSF